MFPLDFPFKKLVRAKHNDWVLDPFCGRGTTNYAARLRGVNSVGIDSNPIANTISTAKLLDVSKESIIDLANRILTNPTPNNIPVGEFWEWCYHPQTLFEICQLREQLLIDSSKAARALKAIMLGILHGPLMKTRHSYLSNQMPRTYASKPDYSVRYWKKREMHAPKVDTLKLIEYRVNYVFENLPQPTEGTIVSGDARTVPIKELDKEFSWVITSPPYFGMSTYLPDQWLRNWFLGGTDRVEYSHKDQITHGSENSFVRDLAEVWRNTASSCKPNARLIIRFGGLPSTMQSHPKDLLKRSIVQSNCGWEITAVRKAGEPESSQRQATHFNNNAGNYVEEVDLYATLKN